MRINLCIRINLQQASCSLSLSQASHGVYEHGTAHVPAYAMKLYYSHSFLAHPDHETRIDLSFRYVSSPTSCKLADDLLVCVLVL